MTGNFINSPVCIYIYIYNTIHTQTHYVLKKVNHVRSKCEYFDLILFDIVCLQFQIPNIYKGRGDFLQQNRNQDCLST